MVTMKQFLLDTDICIEIFKHNEKVLSKISEVGETNCFITEITIAELFYGAAKSGREEHYEDVALILKLFDVIPLFSSLRLYGINKYKLEKQKKTIGEFDLLIGSCAVHNNMVMVTSNIKHYVNVPRIAIEDWAEKSKFNK